MQIQFSLQMNVCPALSGYHFICAISRLEGPYILCVILLLQFIHCTYDSGWMTMQAELFLKFGTDTSPSEQN